MSDRLCVFLRQSGKGAWSSRIVASVTGGAFLGLFIFSTAVAALIGAIASTVVVESLRAYSKHRNDSSLQAV